ncbi:MAG: serine/threonine protein kinase [Verrucomicrobiales bacterium]|nr:serine/threonine protein kinase [Verrucomicrobiales bacterium]|tara:strand:- start:3175 stop:4398 length:1224 start_codon:yes stop_codon:yes gene_type:complete
MNRSICTLALLTIGLNLNAGDWTEFRGPGAQGHSNAKNLPVNWTATKNVAWKASVKSGWSSPVLYQGKVFLTTADDSLGNLLLGAVALDQKTGKVIWEQVIFDGHERKKHKKNSDASPTIIAEGNRLYAHFGPNGTAALDLKGKIIWKQESLPYPPVHGNGGSPALVDDKLIFTCDAAKKPFIVALNKNTGRVVWRRNRHSDASRKFSFCTPLLIEAAGRKQVICPGSGVVYSLNPDNGEIIWECYYGQGYSVVPRPIYGHGLVYIATGFGDQRVIAIRPTGTGDVTDTHIEWTTRRGAPKTPSLLLIGNELYMFADNGIATCLDAKTGTEIYQERIGGAYSASPVYADGRIYIQDERGKGVVLQPGRTFKVLAENQIGERTLASYAMDDNTIYIRGDENLYKIQAR